MVRSNVDVIVALGAELPLKAAASASRNIPIVFVANNFDPIELGYVKSLAQPGGNATGVVLRQTELAEKQVDLLNEAFPGKVRLVVLWDDISSHQFVTAERRARLLGLTRCTRSSWKSRLMTSTRRSGRPWQAIRRWR